MASKHEQDRETIQVKFELKDPDRLRILGDLSQWALEVERLKEERKQWLRKQDAKIKELELKAGEALQDVERGHEFRPVECIIMIDTVKGNKEWVGVTDEKIHKREKATAEEIQEAHPSLFEGQQ